MGYSGMSCTAHVDSHDDSHSVKLLVVKFLHNRTSVALLLFWWQISPEGRMINMLLDPTGARVATASAATEHNGRLFLGSILGGE